MAVPRWQVILFFGILIPLCLPQLQGCKKGKAKDDGDKKKKSKKDSGGGGGGGGGDISMMHLCMAMEALEIESGSQAYEAIAGEIDDTEKLDSAKIEAYANDLAKKKALPGKIKAAYTKSLVDTFGEDGGMDEPAFTRAFEAAKAWFELIKAKAGSEKDPKKAWNKIFDKEPDDDVGPADITGAAEDVDEDKAKDMISLGDMSGAGGDADESLQFGEFTPIFNAVNGKGKSSLLEDFRGVKSQHTKESFVSLSNSTAVESESDEAWDDRDFTWTRGIHGQQKANAALASPKRK